jgi:hypothetical protein
LRQKYANFFKNNLLLSKIKSLSVKQNISFLFFTKRSDKGKEKKMVEMIKEKKKGKRLKCKKKKKMLKW